MNIGCFVGTRINPQILLEEFYHCTYITIICLIWKSNGFSSNQVIEEFELNFNFVDNVISDKHVKSFF